MQIVNCVFFQSAGDSKTLTVHHDNMHVSIIANFSSMYTMVLPSFKMKNRTVMH